MNTATIKRVGIVFSGGPAPASNAVISSAAISFLDRGIEVYGFLDGFQNLERYDLEAFPLEADIHFHRFRKQDVNGLRRTSGVLIRTSRANPGRAVESSDDLRDPVRSRPLRNILEALVKLRVDTLITIGGDDTLKTANFLHLLATSEERYAGIGIVHLPKTIDNDYFGINFTFGHVTAVDYIAEEVTNLQNDAKSTNSWFVCEVMGRKAGWIAYGVGIVGEANMVISREDVKGAFDLDRLASSVADLMEKRIDDYGSHYGTVVVAEGLADLLPEGLRPTATDTHGNVDLGAARIGELLRKRTLELFHERRGFAPKMIYKRLGYESRCAAPRAFDIMLGSQLGIGAYRATVEERLSGVMVSVGGQFDLTYVPFQALIDRETMRPQLKFISRDSDFYKMARFLESRMQYEEGQPWQ